MQSVRGGITRKLCFRGLYSLAFVTQVNAVLVNNNNCGSAACTCGSNCACKPGECKC
ncbi:hypothetical protein F5141DRAFT_822357 [Pisolithus sp. B1]|nr:hypothetical protein F5141DRAFT_822357 [Pisolithus sp. B1]